MYIRMGKYFRSFVSKQDFTEHGIQGPLSSKVHTLCHIIPRRLCVNGGLMYRVCVVSLSVVIRLLAAVSYVYQNGEIF